MSPMHRPRAKPNEPPRESPARRRIVAAARRHFLARGFRRVTMDELAEELGMSKKTLYAHFPGKADLLRAVLLAKLAEAEAEMGRITAECAADFLGGLHRMLACVQRHAEELQPPFLRDLRREAPEMFQVVEARRGELVQRYFGKLLAEGRREGLIRRDVPVRLIMEVLLAAVQGVVNPPKLAELGLTPKAGISAVISVILEGVLTGNGRADR